MAYENLYFCGALGLRSAFAVLPASFPDVEELTRLSKQESEK
jgi:hypothetical protein